MEYFIQMRRTVISILIIKSMILTAAENSLKSDCGQIHQTEQITENIDNGTEYTGRSPWHVVIYDTTDKAHATLVIAGTLVSERVILSDYYFFDYKNKEYEALMSKVSADYRISDNKFQKAYKLNNTVTSRDYDTGSVVLITILQEKVQFNEAVRPACLNFTVEKFNPPDGTFGKVVGFENNILSVKYLTYLNTSSCMGVLGGKALSAFFTREKFCTLAQSEYNKQLEQPSGVVFQDSKSSLYYVRGIYWTVSWVPKGSVLTFHDLYVHYDRIAETIRNADLPQ